jgi:hypothetical protein
MFILIISLLEIIKKMNAPETFTALSPAAVGGRRRKLKLVTKKKARKALKKLGMKLRGGADAPVVADAKTDLPALKMGGADPAPVVPAMGGRRRSKKATRRRRSASVFGL